MINYFYTGIFLFGLFIGSFLNMLIDRLPREEQIWTGRSHCDKCGKSLKWYDMFPVFSWLFLRGRCRFCRSPIPMRNTVVEIITGSLFSLASYFHLSGLNYELRITNYELISLICELIVFSSFIAIFFIDLDHHIIPDGLVIAGILASLLLIYSEGTGASDIGGIWVTARQYILTGIGASGFLFMLYFFTLIFLKKEGMGLGDVKFAFLMGLFLGWPKIITAFYIAFLTGAIGGVILILGRKKRFGEHVAFGPFLVFGTLIAYYFSSRLIKIILPIY